MPFAGGQWVSPVRDSGKGRVMAFAVSTARVDITPTQLAFMGGYGTPTPRLATGTYSRLYARCAILWDDGSPNAIVSVDSEGFAQPWHRALRARLLPLAAWSSSDIVLLSTHTHNGPAA